MHQENLWATSAVLTGMSIVYYAAPLDEDRLGTFRVLPHWSKGHQPSGEVVLALDQCSEEILPELAHAAFFAMTRTNADYAIPRYVQQAHHDYQGRAH